MHGGFFSYLDLFKYTHICINVCSPMSGAIQIKLGIYITTNGKFLLLFVEFRGNPDRFSPDLDRALKRVLNSEETSFEQV